VGDILLRYVYPDYTGLEPVEVPNSTGEAHGPPGTVVEVRARAADPVRSAALIAYDQPPLEAIVSEGREISSRFTIGSQPGTWRLVLAGQGEPRTTREYPITPEGDLPPDVTVDGDDSYEVAVDAIVDLTWSARDDFGLSRVTLEVDEREGRELRVPRERVAEVSGVASFRPVDLGLGPGDVVSLTVAAWDNDEVAGSKVGRSRVIRLTVLGQAARDRRRAERTDALIEAMLAVLADHLEDPWPAGDTEGELAAWGEALSGRYAAIEEVIAEYWDDLPQDAKERRQVEQVVSTARDLIRYTQVSFTPGSPVEPPEQAFVVTAELRDAAVVALEDAILFLDTLVREEALGRVARQTEDAARLAERLSEVLAAEDPDPLAVAAQLDQLERMLAELTRQAARLEAGPLREFVNQRTSELQSLLEAAREALAAGEMEEARRLMERIARDLQQLAEGVEDELSRRGEQDSELREQAADLDAELARLEAEERQLQEDVTALRDASDESQRDRLDALWRELDEVTGRMAEATGAYAEGLERAERSFNERERGASLDEAANQLGQASQARDLGGAEREAARARLEQVGVQRALDREERARGGQLPGPGRAELGAVQRELARAEQLIEQLRQADQQWDPRMAQRLSELESRQQALQEQLEAARGMAEQLTRELPMEPRGMSEALEEAGEQMGRAGRSMQRGEAMGAEGSAGAAAQRIAEAREALREAMQQGSAGSQARRRGQGQPGGEDEGEGQAEGEGEEEGGQGFRDRPLELPAPEEFRTPEEYRRALLEGMEGDVPEEYRALKRRYYEELVNQ
jgi:hypothetical protein